MPKVCIFAWSLLIVPVSALSQHSFGSSGVQEPTSFGEGWAGFADVSFLLKMLLTLLLATVLGSMIAYHPKRRLTAETIAEIEAPKVYIMYAVIGAFIGILVVQYGLFVGFVLFGIGGLIRFRTLLPTATLTGHVIFVTLIGLACGLNLPHVAVITTIFGFVLIYILDSRTTYQINVMALSQDCIAGAAEAYRQVLEKHGCRILSEKKNPLKERVTFVFRNHGSVSRHQLDDLLSKEVDPALKGAVDWHLN